LFEFLGVETTTCRIIIIIDNHFNSEVPILSPSSVYLHFPFCRSRCYYCDFAISVLGNKTNPNTSVAISDYVAFLCREIKLTQSEGRALKTIFFGGGTPSLLPVKHLETILTSLREQFSFAQDVEISLEIDPGTFTQEQLFGYLQLGVNRVSLGVQAFQDVLLQVCGRSHSVKDIYNSIEIIHNLNIKNFSLDLISGLPQQTLTMWENSLDCAIKINPAHVSCYDLVLESVTAFGKQYQPGKKPLPSDEETAKMYQLASEKLRHAGYLHYEISNYAQSNYQCQHNRVYWENRPYYAFGMGAASYVKGVRFTRPRTRKLYYQWVENGCPINEPKLSPNDILLEQLMLGLRLAEGVDIPNILSIKPDKKQEVLTKIYQALQPYLAQNWLEISDQDQLISNGEHLKYLPSQGKLRLKDPEGFLFSNTILASLFEALE
jgi:oxygen-independent coproporphyrinogen-3 oxidase